MKMSAKAKQLEEEIAKEGLDEEAKRELTSKLQGLREELKAIEAGGAVKKKNNKTIGDFFTVTKK